MFVTSDCRSHGSFSSPEARIHDPLLEWCSFSLSPKVCNECSASIWLAFVPRSRAGVLFTHVTGWEKRLCLWRMTCVPRLVFSHCRHESTIPSQTGALSPLVTVRRTAVLVARG